MSYKFDVFVSYKAEDANIARGVTEALVTNNIAVWFDEYEIDIKDYNEDRKDPDRDFKIAWGKIFEGIDNSKYFLLFTNQKWEQSESCTREIERIKKAVGAEHTRIFQICVRHNESDAPLNFYQPSKFRGESIVIDYPSSSPRDEKNHNRICEIITYINKLAWFENELLFELPELGSNRIDLRFGISIRSGPYIREEPLRSLKQVDKFPGEHYEYEGFINDYKSKLVIAINPFFSALDEFDFSEDRPDSDFEIREEMARIAEHWLGSKDMTNWGLHILYFENQRQFSMTSVTYLSNSNLYVWERRYVINLMNQGNVTGNLTLVFDTILPTNDAESLKKFLQLTGFFDAIIYSLQIPPLYDSLFDSEVRMISLVKLALSVLVFGVFIITNQALLCSCMCRGLLPVFAGVTILDFLSTINNTQATKSCIRYGMMLGLKMTFPISAYSSGKWRIYDHVLRIFQGTIFGIITKFVIGLIPALILLLIAYLTFDDLLSSSWTWFIFGAIAYYLGSFLVSKAVNENIFFDSYIHPRPRP